MTQAPFVVVDSSLPEKIDALQREISELKGLLLNFAPRERTPRRLRLPEVLSRMGRRSCPEWGSAKPPGGMESSPGDTRLGLRTVGSESGRRMKSMRWLRAFRLLAISGAVRGPFKRKGWWQL